MRCIDLFPAFVLYFGRWLWDDVDSGLWLVVHTGQAAACSRHLLLDAYEYQRLRKIPLVLLVTAKALDFLHSSGVKLIRTSCNVWFPLLKFSIGRRFLQRTIVEHRGHIVYRHILLEPSKLLENSSSLVLNLEQFLSWRIVRTIKRDLPSNRRLRDESPLC